MNLKITIGDERAAAVVHTTLSKLEVSKTLLDDGDRNIVMSLINSLFPKFNTVMTRVRGVDYKVEIH